MGKTIDNYMLLEQIGEGTFAKVYKAKHLVTQKQFAVKVISSQKLKDIPKLQQGIVNEINILSKLRNECDYIICYVDMLKTANNFYFVYQFCNGGTLDKLIQKEGCFPQQKAVRYLRQILQAFKVLNKHNIMHRDLKPENILIHNGNIKIADFSFCKLLENKNDLTQTMLGSPIYMAPEVLKGQIYTIKADVWSMGIVFYQMLFGKCPFQSKSIALLIKLLQKQDLYLPNQPKISQISQQFIRRVIVKDYNQRLGWDQIFSTYHITQQGQLINRKQLTVQQQQTELRSSMRNSNGFGLRLTIPSHGSQNGNLQPNTYANQNQNTNNNFISPRSGYLQSPLSANPSLGFNRSMQYSKQTLHSPALSQKSPYKTNELRNTTDFRNNSFNLTNLNTSNVINSPLQSPNQTSNANQNQNQNNFNVGPQRVSSYQSSSFYKSGSQQSNLANPSNSQNGDNSISTFQNNKISHQNSLNLQISSNNSNSRHDKNQTNSNYKPALTRIQIFTKNHHKSIQINQMALDIFTLQQAYSNYICYFLFKNVCKQIQTLHQNLRKQSMSDQVYKDFRFLVQNQLQNISNVIKNFYQAIIQQQKQTKILGQSNKNMDEQLLESKQKIIKLYIENLNDTDQDVRLASQVVDYLQQNILIKRDAYDRMSRQHLYKQMKNKTIKEVK